VAALRHEIDPIIGPGGKTGGGVRHIDFLHGAVTF
jgi:hypothetical protein